MAPQTFLIKTYGSSTGLLPMKVRTMNDEMKTAILVLPQGENLFLVVFMTLTLIK